MGGLFSHGHRSRRWSFPLKAAGYGSCRSLLTDYVLTVAVSISSGVQNASSALPWLDGHEATAASVLVFVLMAMNLRGTKESGKAFAVPTYLFMISVILMGVWGYARYKQPREEAPA